MTGGVKMDSYKIGKNVLENLTQAMYDDSRVIYREYIQNAADQIDIAINNNSFPDEELQIIIDIDTKKRNIFIEDNASGVPEKEVKKRLGDIADSEKIQGESKGFRGIGRLGGIEYCKEFRFVTSYPGESVQTTMIWDATKLREILNDPLNHDSAGIVLDKVITYKRTPCKADKHFFRVEMLGVNEESDKLLDVDNIRQYISEVAPVDFSKSFRLTPDIKKFVNEHSDEIPPIHIYDIFIRHDNGDLMKVEKNYSNGIFKVNNGKKTRVDDLNGIQADIIRDDNGTPVAWIWYAISSFKAAINEVGNPFRGLRLRQFNILIGDRYTLTESPKFFKESRGNNYFIGEIHTIAKGLRPNARRDYFNESNEVREFEYALKKYISKNLDGLYKDGSTINSSYDKIEKLAGLQKSFVEKQSNGFSSPTEKEKLEKEIETAKENVKKAVKEIERIKDRSKDAGDTPLSKLVNTVTNGRNINLEKVKSTLNKAIVVTNAQKESMVSAKPINRPLDKSGKRTPLLIDELSCLNRSERKLVSKIYDVIHKNLVLDEADSLIRKIQEELKKDNGT